MGSVGNFPLDRECGEKTCQDTATRVLVMVECGEQDDESDVTLMFACDLHAQVYQAMFRDHGDA